MLDHLIIKGTIKEIDITTQKILVINDELIFEDGSPEAMWLSLNKKTEVKDESDDLYVFCDLEIELNVEVYSRYGVDDSYPSVGLAELIIIRDEWM